MIAACSGAQRRALLEDMAAQLLEGHVSILSANALDMQAARAKGASNATLDRLLLDAVRVQGMATALREARRSLIHSAKITRRIPALNGVQQPTPAHPAGPDCDDF